MSVLVIAEAGVNHNGDLGRALELVDAAAAAGADVVKFQTFRTADIVIAAAGKAAYQQQTTGSGQSQYDMLVALELDEAAHHALQERCRQRGIRFLSTPFDFPSLRLLTEGLGLDTIKIPSGEITNAPLILAIARSGRRVILSTGASTLAEVQQALSVLAFGYTRPHDAAPGIEAFRAAYADEAGRAALAANVQLMHCTSEYPAPYAEVNLRAMDALRRTFGLEVGLSDHTEGIAVALAAVGRGAASIEKHFTLDKALPGPDHRMSLDPGELAALVTGIRQVEAALGDGLKGPTPSERRNLPIIRKALVAARPIARGSVIGPDDVAAKRISAKGVSPMRLWELLGRIAERDYAADQPLEMTGERDGMVLRRACSADFPEFLRLKSEPADVFWTGHAQPPNPERLASWFEGALNQRVILIAEDKGAVIGYAYLILEGGAVEAAVAVSQAVSGQGHGRRIVAQAADMAGALYPGQPVLAWIYPQNLASVRAHEAAGYVRRPGMERRVVMAGDPTIDTQGCWFYDPSTGRSRP
jgi:N-acetylneuraminate synthase